MSAALAYPEDFPADHRTRDPHTAIVGGDPNFPAGQSALDAHSGCVSGDLSSGGHTRSDTQTDFAVAPTSPDPASSGAAPKVAASGPGTLTPEQASRDTAPIGHSPARAPSPPAPASNLPTPIGAAPVLAETDSQRGSAKVVPASSIPAPSLADPLLALAADVLDDLERVRIANENRLRQLTRTEEDSDGLERGFGLPVDHPDVARLAALVEGLAAAEHQATLNLGRRLRKHPLGPWVKQARGVGEKQAARLLASIGDPYWNTLHNRPRTVSELWAYAGYHVLRTGQAAPGTQPQSAGPGQTGGNPDHRADEAHRPRVGVAATRARGQRANWSANAKMRAHLVAVSIVKAGGPYRETYDKTRAKYDGAVHATECKRCGPAGKPAAAGSPLSAGHQHARALRAVAKEVLRDLWREAKRIHEQHDPD